MKKKLLPFFLCYVLSSFAQVQINPGDSIQLLVNANPPGTTFNINPGLYRLQYVTPKDSDTFIGLKGAILNGSKIIYNFIQQGNNWVADSQYQAAPYHPGADCLNGYNCKNGNDVFVNDTPLKHVDSLNHLTTGCWWFDYTNHMIYLYDDPTGKKVETSSYLNQWAFSAFSGACPSCYHQRTYHRKIRLPCTVWGH